MLLVGYIDRFTYAGLFVILVLCGLGLPLPEDIALLAGGFLVHRGITDYPITLVVSLVGVVTGDNSLFFLGRRFGAGWVKYLGLSSPQARGKIDRIQEFMQRHGHRAIFYARFLAGLRALVYLTAGSFGVPPPRFFLFDLLGALISVPIVVSIGYVFGGQIEQAIRFIGGFEHIIWIVVTLSLLIYGTRWLVTSRWGTTDSGA